MSPAPSEPAKDAGLLLEQVENQRAREQREGAFQTDRRPRRTHEEPENTDLKSKQVAFADPNVPTPAARICYTQARSRCDLQRML